MSFIPLKHYTAWLIITVLSFSTFASNPKKQLVTSYNLNYQVAMHINKRKLYIDRVPHNSYFSEYQVTVSQPYDLQDDPEISSDYNPLSAPALVGESARGGKAISLSLRRLKDGVYNVNIYKKKPSFNYMHTHNELYQIPIQVVGKEITFIQSPHFEHNQTVLDAIPTSPEFLAQCLKGSEAVPVQSAVFRDIARQLTLSSSSPGVTVERTVNWIANNLRRDLDHGVWHKSKMDALSIIEKKRTVDYGINLVGFTILRAAGIPTLIVPIEELQWNSPWYSASSGIQTFQREILLAYYNDAWRFVDPHRNALGQYSRNRYTCLGEGRIGQKGVDMTLAYFSNHAQLLYTGDFKYQVESFKHPVAFDSQALTVMNVDSIDNLATDKHIVTSYCRPYALSLESKDSILSVQHLPILQSLQSCWLEVRNMAKKTIVRHTASIYDTPQIKLSVGTPATYFINLYDKNNEYYVGEKLLPIHINNNENRFVEAVHLKYNRMIMDSVAKTLPEVRQELLGVSELYPTTNSKARALAQEITQGLDSDYAKIEAIYKWVATHIHYDDDALYSGKYPLKDNTVGKVLQNKRGVCSGYTYLACTLIRIVGIPAIGLRCVTVPDSTPVVPGRKSTRYHIFPMAYCDNRWVLMDPTWDSKLIYLDNQFQSKQKILNSMVYFDATLSFLSQSRKLIMPQFTRDAAKWKAYLDYQKIKKAYPNDRKRIVRRKVYKTRTVTRKVTRKVQRKL